MVRPHERRRRADYHTRAGRARRARTEKRIVTAALGVFAELGPDAPKIDDFIRAADVSRGTFYNHFDSVEELLAATSEWMTRQAIETIENALRGLDDPALRVGVGLRLLFAKARTDVMWCRFVSRVWMVGGGELPSRDVDEGLRRGVFSAPSTRVARDLLFGTIREALRRIGQGQVGASYGLEMTEMCLRALGARPRSVAAAMRYELPSTVVW